MTPSLQQEYGFTVSAGAVVMSVISGTGAAAAGVKQGDIIVGINKTIVGSAQDVGSVISALRPGDVIALHVVRGKRHLTINVTLGTATQELSQGRQTAVDRENDARDVTRRR